MSFFRKHIIKIAVILLIQAGFLMCWSPTQQRNQITRSFTNWLTSYLKGKKNDTVKKKVEDLSTATGEISQLMVKASELISKNANHFNIPLKKNKPTEKDVYRVLLVEWNIYHQSATSGNALSVEHTKNQLFYNSEKGHRSYRLTGIHPTADYRISGNIDSNSLPITSQTHCTIPLSGGIAIGAP